MGNWYVNTVVKNVQKKDVADFLNRSGRRAVVLPSTVGYTVICDEASESFDENYSRNFNAELSTALQCKTATFMNADDDLLSYRLFENGVLVDEYYSLIELCEEDNPSEFACESNMIHAHRLAAFFDVSDEAKLEKILSCEYVFEVERHAELEQALGLKNSAGNGYRHASRGEFTAPISDVVVTGA